MKIVAASAVAALLAVSGAVMLLATEQEELPAQTTTEATEPDSDSAAPEAEGGKMEEPDTDGSQPPDTSNSKSSPTNNVLRHRPGACPEGPPCKTGD